MPDLSRFTNDELEEIIEDINYSDKRSTWEPATKAFLADVALIIHRELNQRPVPPKVA
jgi:hypothetical protein